MKIPRSLLPVGVLVIAFAMFIIVIGCDEDNPADAGDEFELPPESSFIMDFDDFEPQVKAAKINAVMTKDNWGFAALNVAVWNTVLTVALAVPVASFLEAFRHEAVMQPDGSWQWSYNFNAGGVHTAVLNGKIVENEVVWNMYISKQDEFTDFLWYTGTCNLARSAGEWTLNHLPTDPTPFLLIEWHRDTGEGTADLKYTNIISGSPGNGDYIFYGVDYSAFYDRFYTIYSALHENATDIEWDFTTKAGRVRDELHFEDTDWHCWDNILDDIDCPAE